MCHGRVAKLTLDCSPPGSSVHGIFQARILEWVAIPFSSGSSSPRLEPRSPGFQDFFYHLSHRGSPNLVRSLFLKVLQSKRSQAVHRQNYLEKLHLILDTYTYPRLVVKNSEKKKAKRNGKKITERIQLWYVHDMSIQPGFEGWTLFEAEKRKKLGTIHSIRENGKQPVFNIHFQWIIKVVRRKTGKEKRILLHSWVIMMKEKWEQFHSFIHKFDKH